MEEVEDNLFINLPDTDKLYNTCQNSIKWTQIFPLSLRFAILDILCVFFLMTQLSVCSKLD